MLFWREIKKLAGSAVYILFVAVLIVELYSQGVFSFENERLEEPQPGQNYGVHSEEIPELVMPTAIAALYQEFAWNNYTTYPIGFYKKVKLNEKEKEEMAGILSELTGTSSDRFLSAQTEEGGALTDKDLEPQEALGYEEFKKCMERADRLLGGGSNYAVDSLAGFGKVPVTYEEVRVEYQMVKDKDQFTGGYARLFSDYAGVMAMSILPVFLAVWLCLKDRRSKMSELVCSRSTSSFTVIVVRYAAILTMVMIPVIVLAYYSNMKVWNLYEGMQLDYLAPLKYALGWLLPSAMMSAAVGMFLTELTGTPAAIAVQCFWWFLDLNAGYKSVSSAYGLFRLAPRHNAGAQSRFRIQDFTTNFNRLMENRLLIAGLSLLLIILTVFVYEWKRRGIIGERFKIRSILTAVSNRKNKSAS